MIIPPTAANRSSERIGELEPPINGMDLTTNIRALKSGSALRLENLVCRADGVATRNGHVSVMTQIGGLGTEATVTAILTHGRQRFAATAGTIYRDRTPVATSLGAGAWSSASMVNPAGEWLIAANGTVAPRVYNGTTWAASTITGVDAATLATVMWHQRRLFFAPATGLTIWYLGLNAMHGAASPIYVGPLARKGGNIAGMASLTGDAARKLGGTLVVVTTMGELVAYAGSDPDNRATWTDARVYEVPRPVPGQCLAEIGGALVLLTIDGLLSIPEVLAEPASRKETASLSERIWPAARADLGIRGSTQRWSVLESGSAGVVIIDAPSETNQRQYVREMDTGGWSFWSGTGATCWREHDGALYFGTADGRICRYEGHDDDGEAIDCWLVDRFDQHRTGNQKSFHRLQLGWDRPLGVYVPRAELLMDYRDPPSSFAAAYQAEQYRQWADTDWPDMPMDWAVSTGTIEGRWRGISGRGRAAALMLGFKTRAAVTYKGGRVMFNVGAGV